MDNANQIVVAIPGQPDVIVAGPDLFEKAQQCITAVAATPTVIDDEDMLDYCDELFRDITAVRADVESARKEAKEPVLDMGRAIDGAAKELLAPLEKARVAIGNRLADWTRRERQRAQEAEAARRKAEAAALEEQRKREREAAKAVEEGKPEPPPAAPIVVASEPIPVARVSSAVSSRKAKTLVIDDLSAIPASIKVGDQDVQLLKPIEAAIKRLLNLGVEVPGCHMQEEEVLAARRRS